MYSTSEREPSSGENSTSSVYSRACATAARTWPLTSSRVVCSLRSMWMSLVAMNVWMRGRSASLTAFQAASMSCLLVRARPQMTGPSTSRAIACTDSKSPGEVIGKPASMTSTPSRASWWAISSFSCLFSEIPGDCSPSRRVVSKIRTRVCSARRRRGVAAALCRSCRSHAPSRSRLPLPLCWVCGYAAATRYSPRGGGAGEARGRELERHLRRRLAPARRARLAPTSSSTRRRSTTLPTLRRSVIMSVRGAGFLEAERARDDRLDRAVVEQLAQRLDPRLRACRGPSTA